MWLLQKRKASRRTAKNTMPSGCTGKRNDVRLYGEQQNCDPVVVYEGLTPTNNCVISEKD